MVILAPLAYMDTHQFSPLPVWKANTAVEAASLVARSAQLMIWMWMTNERDIEGVFGSFHWSRDVSDNEVHFQGLKWGFTQFFSLNNNPKSKKK